MKTILVIFTNQYRTGDRCVPSLLKSLPFSSKRLSFDFYFPHWNQDGQYVLPWRHHLPTAKFFQVSAPDIRLTKEDLKKRTRDLDSVKGILYQHYFLSRSVLQISKRYDIILRSRYDLLFNHEFQEVDFLYCDSLKLPSKSNWLGINDQFAYGPYDEMTKYMSAYHWIKENISNYPTNPEVYFMEYMRSKKTLIDHINIEYKLLRQTKSEVPYENVFETPNPFKKLPDEFGYRHRIEVIGKYKYE